MGNSYKYTKSDIESHLSWNTNKIIVEYFLDVVVYGYHASDTLAIEDIQRYYNRLDQIYIMVNDVIKQNKEKFIEIKKNILILLKKLTINPKNQTAYNCIILLRKIKLYHLLIVGSLQEKQYFFRVTQKDLKKKKKIEEVIITFNTVDTNKLISLQIMTIMGIGAKAYDILNFQIQYKYFNRLDLLYISCRCVLDKNVEEIDSIRNFILNYIEKFEKNKKYRSTENFISFSKLINKYHINLISSLQAKSFFFRIAKRKDKTLRNASLFNSSSIYGD